MSEPQKKSVLHFQLLSNCHAQIEKRNKAIIDADKELEEFFLAHPQAYEELEELYEIDEIIPNFDYVPF